MSLEPIRLRVLLPYEAFIEDDAVESLVAPTAIGFLGILPHRRDCVVAVKPGILTYHGQQNQEEYVALDEGVLVKTGLDVTISVRNAVRSNELGKLREAVEKQFSTMDNQELSLRVVASRLETALVRRSAEFCRE
jgi:F-type H+-transporting ATPase subunit epsilon